MPTALPVPNDASSTSLTACKMRYNMSHHRVHHPTGRSHQMALSEKVMASVVDEKYIHV